MNMEMYLLVDLHLLFRLDKSNIVPACSSGSDITTEVYT